MLLTYDPGTGYRTHFSAIVVSPDASTVFVPGESAYADFP
jgi:hypothetical protein